MSHTQRVIVLVDMDCFYCQVEEKLDPALQGKPIAVVQYTTWKGGGIIAVNYPARDKGVRRGGMTGNEAKKICPDINLVRVPELRGKADLTKYREAGKRVAEVLQTFTGILERASVDEAYLDITEAVEHRIEQGIKVAIEALQNTYVVGCDITDFIYNVNVNKEFLESDFKLAVGGIIAEEIRAEVSKKTGYKCSAGVAHNKILAKLVCGLHKPNKQTILPQNSVQALFENLPLRKIQGLGGKFGEILAEKLRISNVGELLNFSEKDLIRKFDEKDGKWLFNLARGINHDPVKSKFLSKSIGCCKNFPGPTALRTEDNLEHWVNELTSELHERLEKDIIENNRKAKQMVIHFINGTDLNGSRTHPLKSYDHFTIKKDVLEVIKKNCQKPDGFYHVTFLGVSAGNFIDVKKVREITSFFKVGERKNNGSIENTKTVIANEKSITSSNSEINVTNLLVNNSAEKDDHNSSVYSATTEEMEDDEENLIFYDDVQNIQNEPNERKCDIGNQSEDSFSNELFTERQNDNNDEYKKPSSFFSNYFDNLPAEASIQRNFNTSKFLDDLNSDHENLDKEVERINNCVTKDTSNSRSSPVIGNFVKDIREICTECKKSVFISELESHIDYHFALKLVKEEAHLYQPKKNTPTDEMPKDKKLLKQKSNKRKPSFESNTSIVTFLKKDENVEHGEICLECNKKIKSEEMVSHLDYHTAKKLHSELNYIPKKIDTVRNNNFTKLSKEKQKVSSVFSFFKSR